MLRSQTLKKIWPSSWRTTTLFKLLLVVVWCWPPPLSEKLEISIASLHQEHCQNMLAVHRESARVERKQDMLNHEVVIEDSTAHFIEWHCHRYQEWAMIGLGHTSNERYPKANQSRKRLSVFAVKWWTLSGWWWSAKLFTELTCSEPVELLTFPHSGSPVGRKPKPCRISKTLVSVLRIIPPVK